MCTPVHNASRHYRQNYKRKLENLEEKLTAVDKAEEKRDTVRRDSMARQSARDAARADVARATQEYEAAKRMVESMRSCIRDLSEQGYPELKELLRFVAYNHACSRVVTTCMHCAGRNL